MRHLLYTLVFIALILEGTVTSLPLVLVALILLAINLAKTDVFLIAFLSSMLLDVFLVRATGLTGIFYLCILLLIFLYNKKYETQTLVFILLATALSSTLYLFIFPAPDIFLQVIISTLLAGGLFSLFRLRTQKKENN